MDLFIGASLFFLMSITAIDVVGRYIFGVPLMGSTEMTEFTLGVVILSTLILLIKNADHIYVDLLESVLPNMMKRGRDLISAIIIFLVLTSMAYGVFLLAKRAERDDLVSEYLGWSVSFFNYLSFGLILIAGGFALRRFFTMEKRKKKITREL